MSFPEPRELEDHKVRGKPERFADHYTQATLFWNSQTDVEKAHIVSAFRFELSRVQTPAIRERMVSGLMNVAPELASAVAEGLGMREMPEPMPKVLKEPVQPEVDRSAALSLFARPGDGTIRARRIAVIVADGVDAAAVRDIADRLTAAGAVPRLVGSRLGAVESAGGDLLEADTTLEATPSVLFDALVIAGVDADRLKDGRAVEFLKDQYRHCKPILIVGEASALLERAGIPAALPSGQPDPGLILARDHADAVDGFIAALARHRHFERESDPPIV